MHATGWTTRGVPLRVAQLHLSLDLAQLKAAARDLFIVIAAKLSFYIFLFFFTYGMTG